MVRARRRRRHIESGKLRRVSGAAEFLYPAYAVFAEGADASVVSPALDGLRHATPRRRSTKAGR